MITPSRFRLSLVALCVGAALFTACSDEPLPRESQSIEERRLGTLSGPRSNPFAEGGDTSKTWEGSWILGGHMLALQQTKLPEGQVGNNAYVFGYSTTAQRYYMIHVQSGPSDDNVDVSWFTINGRQWRFMPRQDTVAGKPTVRELMWDTQKPAAALVVADSLDPVPPPKARAEMGVFAKWPGRWPNKHTERGLTYDGTFDAKFVSNGNFMVWSEKNNIVDSTGKSNVNRQVRVWGYEDVPMRFYRLDFLTYANKPLTPRVIFTPWFEGDAEKQGLLLLAPLTKEKVGTEVQPVRYAIGMMPTQPDTLILVQQYLFGGVTWTDAPGGMAKWGRLR